MTLLDVLKMISGDSVPLRLEQDDRGRYEIDSRPQSVYKVTICFMAEEETWVTCYVDNEILVPWYNCEVHTFNPSHESDTLEIWLEDVEYLKQNFAHCLLTKGEH